MGQKQTGATINTNIGVNAVTGIYTFTFNDPFDMLINLNNSTGVIVSGSIHNDKFNLMSATGLTISGSQGNNIYNISAAAAGLADNIIHGNTGYDFITLTGGNALVDLTTGSSAIEAVVGNVGFTGQAVTVKLNQLVSSALTDGGAGRAFAAVIGTTGHVNVLQTGKFTFVGVVDAAHHGFDALGNAITGSALTSLMSSVTDISAISGNLASIYAGSATGAIPVHESEVSTLTNAYVFSDGVKAYTVWTDGTVSPTDAQGNVLADIFHPTAATPDVTPLLNSVAVFSKADQWAGANLFTDAAGLPDIRLIHGNTTGYTAIDLRAGVTGVAIHGDDGNNGVNYFGLGASGGNNHVFGSKAGNVFDLQLSTALQDLLTGGNGFDVVRAAANGSDVDLTANNAATSKASTSIDAVVGSANLSAIQTVELDVGKLKVTIDATGAKTSIFEALLGSSTDTLTLSGGGKWLEVATFAPGALLPAHASALVNADILNATFGVSPHKAENSLIGHLFEQVDIHGAALKYLTVYTDATIDNLLAAPVVHLI
jgi:hypothetical protein